MVAVLAYAPFASADASADSPMGFKMARVMVETFIEKMPNSRFEVAPDTKLPPAIAKLIPSSGILKSGLKIVVDIVHELMNKSAVDVYYKYAKHVHKFFQPHIEKLLTLNEALFTQVSDLTKMVIEDLAKEVKKVHRNAQTLLVSMRASIDKFTAH